MTTTLVATVANTAWGSSRRWNAYVEFLVGGVPVASSATGDFALVSGKVTEDMSRAIRRDVQVTLQFPTGRRRTTVPIFRPQTDTTYFTVGSSSVGGTDTIGGSAVGTNAPMLTASGATITDAASDPIYVGTETASATPPLTLSVPATTAPTVRSPWIPTSIGDLLDPNGPTVMRIWAGAEGDEQLLGYFDLVSTPVKIGAGGALIDLTGQSFERRIQKAGFWRIFATEATLLAWQTIEFLVAEVLPSTEFQVTVSPVVLKGASYKPGDDRLSKLGDLLSVAGLEGGFDRNNRYAASPAPATADFGNFAARWEVLDGVNAKVATLNDATRTFSDENSYNGVVVEGTNHADANAAPIMYTLWNTNASSPLYYNPDAPGSSPTGPRPKHVSSDLVSTQSGAAAFAAAELAKVLMISDSVEAQVPANARIEMGHFVRLAADALGVDGMYRVSKVVHDLTGAPAALSLFRFQAV